MGDPYTPTPTQPSTTEGQGLPPAVGLRAKDLLRIVFGLIFAIDAWLKWQPAFRSEYIGILKTAAQGQPAWLHGWFHFWITLVQPRADLFAYATAVIETLIAAALILGLARKFAYVSAALFMLLVWATAEGFGGPYTAGATDIGTAVIYAVVLLALLALDHESAPSRFSLDRLGERRLSWWHHVAEARWRH